MVLLLSLHYTPSKCLGGALNVHPTTVNSCYCDCEMQGLTLLVVLCTLFTNTYGWVQPDQPLYWLQHSFSIRIDGRFSRLEIQNAHRDMVQLQELIFTMKNASVFQELEPSQYAELGQVLAELFHARLAELIQLTKVLLFEFQRIIQAAHLIPVEAPLPTNESYDCTVKIKFNSKLVRRLNQYVEFLKTNWLYPSPPSISDPWNAVETKAFEDIVANRSLSREQRKEIKHSQSVEFYRARLETLFKQRSDSIQAATEIKSYLLMLKESLSEVIALHRSCLKSPNILKRLVFKKCDHVLHQTSFDTFTMDSLDCEPKRDKILVLARIHKMKTYFGPQGNELLLIISLAWSLFHYLVGYIYLSRRLYQHCTRSTTESDYTVVAQHNNLNELMANKQDDNLGSEVKNFT